MSALPGDAVITARTGRPLPRLPVLSIRRAKNLEKLRKEENADGSNFQTEEVKVPAEVFDHCDGHRARGGEAKGITAAQALPVIQVSSPLTGRTPRQPSKRNDCDIDSSDHFEFQRTRYLVVESNCPALGACSPSPFAPAPRSRAHGKSSAMSSEEDIKFLGEAMMIVRKVEEQAICPHRSILYKRYEELRALIHSEAGRGCGEAEWLQTVLHAGESVTARRKVAGALSATQLRGTGEFWVKLDTSLKRRVAEKALCAVYALESLRGRRDPEAQSLRNHGLERMGGLVALDADLALAFLPNGFDGEAGKFVRQPELAAAERTLHALGAPIESLPLKVPVRIKGERLGFLF